jgi:hypothetical protein
VEPVLLPRRPSRCCKLLYELLPVGGV